MWGLYNMKLTYYERLCIHEMHGKIIDLATYLLNIVRIVSKNKAVGILILCFYSHSISGPVFSS